VAVDLIREMSRSDEIVTSLYCLTELVNSYRYAICVFLNNACIKMSTDVLVKDQFWIPRCGFRI